MNDETPLLRQIHPTFMQNGQPTYIAFRPFPRDEGHLSVYDGDMISAEQSYKYHTGTRNLKSGGVMGVLVKECSSIELPTASSPEEFEEHAHIDFTKYGDKKDIVEKSKGLLDFALKRDWMHKDDS